MGDERHAERPPGGVDVVDVDTVTGWRLAAMPGSSGPVELRILRRSDGGGMSGLVRFPAGWSRPVAGRYPTSEVFIVLDGVLQLGDLRFGPSTGGFVPAHTIRRRTHAPGGALAWAHFDGPADFLPMPEQGSRLGEVAPTAGSRPPGGDGATDRSLGGPVVSFSFAEAEARPGDRRLLARHADGWASWVLPRFDGDEPGPAELVAPGLRQWVCAGPGAMPPVLPVPVLLRRPAHPTASEEAGGAREAPSSAAP